MVEDELEAINRDFEEIRNNLNKIRDQKPEIYNSAVILLNADRRGVTIADAKYASPEMLVAKLLLRIDEIV